jgi:hypothetical protein
MDEQARHSRLVVLDVRPIDPDPASADERRWEVTVDEGTTVEAFMPANAANSMAVHTGDELRWVADQVKRAVREAPNRQTAIQEILLKDPLELHWTVP